MSWFSSIWGVLGSGMVSGVLVECSWWHKTQIIKHFQIQNLPHKLHLKSYDDCRFPMKSRLWISRRIQRRGYVDMVPFEGFLSIKVIGGGHGVGHCPHSQWLLNRKSGSKLVFEPNTFDGRWLLLMGGDGIWDVVRCRMGGMDPFRGVSALGMMVVVVWMEILPSTLMTTEPMINGTDSWLSSSWWRVISAVGPVTSPSSYKP